MLVSQNDMFGPNSPAGLPLIYWTKGDGHPIAEWWGRMCAVLFFSFLSGPFVFGADIDTHLKQTLVMNIGLLLAFCSVVFGHPEECAQLTWYPQIGLQVILVIVNFSLVNGGASASKSSKDE